MPDSRAAPPPGPRRGPPRSVLFDMREAIIALSLLMSARYLLWRATDTLNTATPLAATLSTLLLAAEVYGFVTVCLFYLQARRPVPVPPRELPERELPSVDVFVTIFNEPLEVLARTLVGCAALDYPRDRLNVWVLDDGAREEVRGLAERHRARYLARTDRRHAKAGNVNFGLSRTRGELVLVLDCDHIPVRSILRETVGYFSDPKVGFVQMPHHFYNADVFQHNLHLDKELVHEQDLFFKVMLPGRQRTDSVMFAGSTAVLRRAALDSIGGLKTACAIEDTHTSMHLHAKGWSGVFHDKALAAGLSPESFAGYLTQRRRWTQGGVQLFVLDNPLLRPGLTPVQRLVHFASVLYFFSSWARLVFLLTPIFFLVWGVSPLVCSTGTLLAYFGPHYLFSHLAVIVVSREYRNPFWSEVYEVASCFPLSWTALTTVLQPDRLIFNVTPKGEAARPGTRLPWLHALPHATVIGLLCAGVVVATRRMTLASLELNSYTFSCLWAAFNVVLLGCAIEGARERPQLRSGHRVRRRLECELSYHGRRFRGWTAELSESGARIELDTKEHLPPLVRVVVFSADYDHRTGFEGEATTLESEVVHQDGHFLGGSTVGLKFTDLGPATRDSLLRQIFTAPDAWAALERPFVSSWTAFWHILTSLLRPRLRKPKRARRGRARIRVALACRLEGPEFAAEGTLQDLSVSGARLKLAPGLSPPEFVTLRFAAAGADRTVQCRRVHSQPPPKKGLPTPGRHGLKFLSPGHLEPGLLEDLEDAASG